MHTAALDELVEWWQDLARQQINSRAVLLPVPPRWGRTHLINEFTGLVESREALSIVVRVPGAALPEGLGLQALELRKLFSDVRVEHRVAELLGVDRLGGVTQLGLGVAGLFVSPLAALVGLLLTGIGVGAAGKVWDDSLTGQEGMVARLARAVAAVSVSVPVIVVIDDADHLELDLALVLVENLIGRFNGQVLVVAVVHPDGDLLPALTSRAAYGLTEGRVRTVDVDPGMDYQARVDLTAQLCPQLPSAAISQIGHRTQTFTEVFSVASSERLAELDAQDDATVIMVTDEVIDAQVNRAPPSGLAVVLAWAGGILHALQGEGAVKVLGDDRLADDDDVIRFESLIRLADPASPRLAEQVRVLPASKRHRLAEIMLDTALKIGGDPHAGLVDKVVAWQAAHRVRAGLQDRAQLMSVQRELVHGLEDLNDPAAAYHVATTALTEYLASQPGELRTPECNDLSAAVLRLARTQEPGRTDPLIAAAIDAVTAGGAAVGLEARIWAAIDLLGQSAQRDRALDLTDQVTAELNDREDLGAIGNRWRLQLAFHAGRAGYLGIAKELLAPIFNASSSPDENAARAVLRAADGPRTDTRLQIIGLETELATLPPDADDNRLRVHRALAADYGALGDYRRALNHSQQELELRRRIQGEDHPDTLTTRNNIARWTGQSGNAATALCLFQALLPDWVQVLGPDHPSTLATRNNIALFTARCGELTAAHCLFQALLADEQRVLGPYRVETLITRSNIAGLTGIFGDAERALRLFQELLPDEVRVLGPHHLETLTTRRNVANWTGECGDPARALRLFLELLPDHRRVLGADHPDTLNDRSSIARYTGECGDGAEALRLFQQLLPHQIRVLGADHPDTLSTRSQIAYFTGQRNLADKREELAGALRLYKELLPDKVRVLGADHPDTLTTRDNIACLTAACGNPLEGLQLLKELLPYQVRALGADHPTILTTRRNIEFFTRLIENPKADPASGGNPTESGLLL